MLALCVFDAESDSDRPVQKWNEREKQNEERRKKERAEREGERERGTERERERDGERERARARAREIQVIVSHELIGRLMLLAARSPWVSPVLSSLLGFEVIRTQRGAEGGDVCWGGGGEWA